MGFWEHVKIGEGETGNSATLVYGDYKGGGLSISANRNCYWISDGYLGMGGHIFKNTPEGAELARMIQEGVDQPSMQAWMDDLFLQRVNRQTLRQVHRRSAAARQTGGLSGSSPCDQGRALRRLMMLVTREQLRRRLEDGRWHQVSAGGALWFIAGPLHEVQVMLFMRGHWTTIVNELDIGRVRSKYRVRLLLEFVNPV